MSKLSEFLNSCVIHSVLSKKKLAEITEIERTRLVKILNGTRKPDKNDLTKIIQALSLSWEQEQEAYRLAKIEWLGTDTYESMLSITSFLKEFHTFSTRTSPIKQIIASINDSKETFCLTNKTEILHQLQCFLSQIGMKGNQHLRMIFQKNDSGIYNLIASSIYGKENIKIDHLLYYQALNKRNIKSIKHNIQQNSFILPFILMHNVYHPLAIYQDNTNTQLQNALLPFLFLHDDTVINCSCDFHSALISSDPKIIQMYDSLFKEERKKAKEFVQILETQNFIQPYINAIVNHQNSHFYFLLYEPCFASNLPFSIIMSKIHPELLNNQPLISMISQYLKLIQSLKSYTNYFTVQGVYEFMESGCSSQIPKAIHIPLTVEERLLNLQNIINKIRNNEENEYLLNDKIILDAGLSISCYDETTTVFYYNNTNVNFYFQENTINISMYQFLQDLPNSDFVYSKEESLRILTEIYEKYSN